MKTAWRNLWRNRRRTAITLTAVALNTGVLILLVGYVQGLLVQMVDNTTQMQSGEVQVHAPGYLRNRALDLVIKDPRTILETAAEHGLSAVPRQYGFGMAAVDDKERPERGAKSAGAMLWGVEPQAEREAFRLPRYIDRGRYLSDTPARVGEPAYPEAVIGGRLARSLQARVGDELIVFGAAADGSMFDALFRIVGIFELVGEPVDRMGVFVHEREFRRLFYPPTNQAWYVNGAAAPPPESEPLPDDIDPFDLFEQGADAAGREPEAPGTGAAAAPTAERGDYEPPWLVHEIAITSHGTLDSEEIVALLKPATGGDVAQTWQQLNRPISEMIAASSASMTLFYGIFFIVAGLSVMNTMLMATFERMREFGVLKAIGTGPWRLIGMVASEALLLGLIAIAIGFVLGAAITSYLGHVGIDLSGVLAEGTTVIGVAIDPVWYPVFTVSNAVTPVLGMWIICLLASLYPASLAARVRPVEILQAH